MSTETGMGKTGALNAGLTIPHIQAAAIWLMMVSSFFVTVEPAPCDLLFVAAALLFVSSGLSLTVLAAPLIILLILYNIGGFISYLEVTQENKAGMFVITSSYMAVSAIFFAFYIAEDPARRFHVFKSGYVIAALVASVVAIAGYFNVAGTGELLAPMGRAQGTFKDPNVISTFLIPPAMFLVQDMMLGGRRRMLLRAVALLIILACVFLSFSRGAWINVVFASFMMVVLTFVLTPSGGTRTRIILLSIAGTAAVGLLLAYLLTIPEVRTLFLDRLTLTKSYDVGETGRFGNQINSIEFLLERPQGFGPTLFRKIFNADPHNVYLNAFASYGWLGGIAYLILTVSTIYVGFKAVLTRTPWQSISIAIFCPLVSTMLQGVQIDTDHWRHFYWMLGLMWGLYAASAMYVAAPERGSMTPLKSERDQFRPA